MRRLGYDRSALMTLKTRGHSSTPDKIRNEPMITKDTHTLQHILASVLLSEGTGMSFGAITGILGSISADYTRILSSLSLIEYNSEEQTISLHPGGRAQLEGYLARLNSGIININIQTFARGIMFQLLSSSHSYKGTIYLSSFALKLTS